MVTEIAFAGFLAKSSTSVARLGCRQKVLRVFGNSSSAMRGCESAGDGPAHGTNTALFLEMVLWRNIMALLALVSLSGCFVISGQAPHPGNGTGFEGVTESFYLQRAMGNPTFCQQHSGTITRVQKLAGNVFVGDDPECNSISSTTVEAIVSYDDRELGLKINQELYVKSSVNADLSQVVYVYCRLPGLVQMMVQPGYHSSTYPLASHAEIVVSGVNGQASAQFDTNGVADDAFAYLSASPIAMNKTDVSNGPSLFEVSYTSQEMDNALNVPMLSLTTYRYPLANTYQAQLVVQMDAQQEADQGIPAGSTAQLHAEADCYTDAP